MIVMKSLELDDEDKLDAIMPIPMPTKPDYPYGCRICLTEKEFEKLGLDSAEACIDGTIHLHAMGKITSVSKTEGADGECCRVEIQLTDMAIESEDDENEEQESGEDKSKRRSLYKD